jgi:hypothetical protein
MPTLAGMAEPTPRATAGEMSLAVLKPAVGKNALGRFQAAI